MNDPAAAAAAEAAVVPEAAPLDEPAIPVPPTPTMPPVESTRRLLGASFDLLMRSSREMRPASFYIGIVILGTLAPLALAAWATVVTDVSRTEFESLVVLGPTYDAWDRFLLFIAAVGFIIANVDGRIIAASLLGARLVGRPITVRQALARARMVFLRALAATLIIGIPLQLLQDWMVGWFGTSTDFSGDAAVIVTLIVTALLGAPFAYLLTGIVLGDVSAIEALRRSLRVFNARKVAAIVVALFETVAQLLILFGLGVGLDLAFRVADAAGLGPASGALGVMLITVGIVIGVFAIGTLVYTVTAIAIAPQVVMFVGLTHATYGLEHVREGGRGDPDVRRPGQRPFRWITRPLAAWMALGVAGLIGILQVLG